MERRKLGELSCPVKDVVLWISLDWKEALAVAERAGATLEYPPGLGREHPHAVVCALHHGIHAEEGLAGRFDALLESLHAEAVTEVAARAPEEIAAWLRRDFADLPVPAAGLAWALARDPRPELRAVESWFFWRLQVEGLRAFAFGKVEIIEVGA